MTRISFATLAALVAASALTLPAAHAANPFLRATVGSGTNLSYFVVDFKDGTANSSYAFGYRYNGAPHGDTMIDALTGAITGVTGAPGFSAQYSTFTFGGVASRFYTTFGYNDGTTNKLYASNYPALYYSYWTGTTGGDWTEPQFGVSDRILSNGSYDGWTLVRNGNDIAPVTPFITSGATAPEPASLSLMTGTLGLVGAGVVRRKRRPA